MTVRSVGTAPRPLVRARCDAAELGHETRAERQSVTAQLVEQPATVSHLNGICE